MKAKDINAALNAPLSYLDGNPKKPRKLNKWEYRNLAAYRLLTSSLPVGESENSLSERKAHRRFFIKSMGITILSSILCIAFGLLLGFLLMLMDPSHIGTGIQSFFSYGINNLPRVIYTAGPLLLCALSVGFCYKCGLFNIGAPGQYMIAGMVSIICALNLHLPWFVSILIAMASGALVGSIPGLLKAYFNINEVITSIMVNWIVLFVNNVLLNNVPGVLNEKNPTKSLALSTVGDPLVMLPSFTSDKYINLTIVIGIVLAVVLFFVVFKTTFGYRLRAVGFNRDAARYAGISSKRNIILSFVVGGLLAGLGGACFYLLGNAQYTYNISSVDQMGFDAIPIALLANNNPIGILFTTFFISFIKVSGIGLQGVGTYNDKFAEIMIALILYGSAFAVLINTVFLKGGRTLKKGKKKKEGKENGNA